VFCSSVLSVRKRTLETYHGEVFLSQSARMQNLWGGYSLTKDISFSHRTHRFDRPFLRTVSIPQKASGIQISQNVIAKGGCNAL